MLTIADRFDPKAPNLFDSLKSYREALWVNHRLDRDTSGVILFSKTAEAHAALSEMFQARKISKTYRAIVRGIMKEKMGTIVMPISTSSRRGRMTVHPKGKYSETRFSVIESANDFHLVHLMPLTGRTHQLRVHCREMGWPILADSFYSHSASFYLSSIKGKRYTLGRDKEERPLISRTALHAEKIEFTHPFKNSSLIIHTAPPKDFRATWNQVQKFYKG